MAPAMVLALALGCAVLAGGRADRAAQAEGTCAVPDGYALLDGEEQAAVRAINDLRAQAGLAPLAISAALMRPARWKSQYMSATGTFAHDDPFRSWLQRLADCGYPASAMAAENLAAGAASGQAAVQMWWESPPHRANLLSPTARFLGIARAQGVAPYGWYWTANFGAVAGDSARGEEDGAQ
jgi:uncharacterized protein YkwD